MGVLFFFFFFFSFSFSFFYNIQLTPQKLSAWRKNHPGAPGAGGWFFLLHYLYHSQSEHKLITRGAPAALRPPWCPSVPVPTRRRFLHARRHRRRRRRRRLRRRRRRRLLFSLATFGYVAFQGSELLLGIKLVMHY